MAEPARKIASPAQFDRANQHRRAMLAKINIARHQLNMVEDDYRQVLFDETGRLSLKECDGEQLDRILGRMKALGFQPLPKGGPKSTAQHPMARKARALWISLHHLGAVHNPSEQALEAFAKRQLGCDRMVWARQSDAYRLIEALKAMAARSGWPQTAPDGGKASVLQLQSSLCDAILIKLKEQGIANDAWSIDQAAFRLCGMTTVRDAPFSVEDYARLAAALGSKLPRTGEAR